MAKADPRALDPEISLLAQEAGEVRAWVEEICAKLYRDRRRGMQTLTECLCQAYTLVFPALRRLAQEGEEEVRWALVGALAGAADPADPFRAPFLLEILAPLLWDPVPRIRRAARQVLRKTFLSVYPQETEEALVQWAAEVDPAWRALAAQMLGHVPPKGARRALIPLKHLAHTEERSVRRAVLAALRRLARQAPELVNAELQRWQEDPALAALARCVLDGKKLA